MSEEKRRLNNKERVFCKLVAAGAKGVTNAELVHARKAGGSTPCPPEKVCSVSYSGEESGKNISSKIYLSKLEGNLKSIAACVAVLLLSVGALAQTNPPISESAEYYGILIFWSPGAPVPGETIASYNIYKSAIDCQHLTLFGNLKTSSQTAKKLFYDKTHLVSGGTYYYAVSAVDTNGVESGLSGCSSVTVP